MVFDWDSEKAARNLEKHGITFYEAATVFSDPLSMSYYDPDHSLSEHRFITIGMSERGELLMVAHTDHDGDIIRLISARQLTRRERKQYEEGSKQ